MDDKLTLGDVYAQLVAPFPVDEIEIKPGATTRDKAKALALPYADIRVYQERLDAIVGAQNWSVEYRHISESAVFCRLTVLGVVREDVGECHKVDKDGVPDENRSCSAVAQSFKRACSAFGIGRYLYSLPQIWGEFDGQKKQFADPLRVAQDIYKRAGLPTGGGRRTNPAAPERAPVPERRPPPRQEAPREERPAHARPAEAPRAEAPRPTPERAAPERAAPERATPEPRPAEAPRPVEKPAPRGAPAAPPPVATSREEVLANALQKATDGPTLSNIADGISKAVAAGELDEAAQARLRELYRATNTRLGLTVRNTDETRPTPRRK